MSDQKRIESALERRHGMMPATRESLHEFNEQQIDWHGKCRACGTVRRGTLAALRQPCEECGYGAAR